MKKIYTTLFLAFLLFIVNGLNAQTTVWLEDFPYPDGTITSTKWTINSLPSDDWWEVRDNQMEGKELDSEGVWTSETIDISGSPSVNLSVDLSESGNLQNADYIGVYYILDGGTETQFATNGYIQNDFGSATAYQNGLTGNNLVIVIRVFNNGNNDYHRFDNVWVVEPPTNIDCANAEPIGEVTDMPFNTSGVTASGVTPSCGGGTAPLDLWYAYTPTATGIATIDLCGSNYDSRLSVWDGCAGTELACNDDNGPACTGTNASLSLNVSTGTTYYVQVGGYNANAGSGDLTISVVAPPSNDDCANAEPIGEVTDYSFDTDLASASGVTPSCGGVSPIDIWYAYTPSISGLATFDLCGSNFDSRIAIWDGCAGTELACNDDNGPACNGQNASLELTVSAGTTYYVQVGGYDDATGTGDLTISVVYTPPNNDCANAIAIGEVNDLPFNTADATASGLDPSCGGQAPLDLWYAYTPTATGIATFDLCGSSFNTRLAIWSDCNPGSDLECNSNNGPVCQGQQSSIEMEVVSGTTYYVQIGGNNQNTGEGDLTIELTPYPSNNDCINATIISEVIDMPFSTEFATQSNNTPNCGFGDNNDIWFWYQATQTGLAMFDLCGSEYTTRLAIWADCDDTDPIECDVRFGPECLLESSSIEMQVNTGAFYLVQIGGTNGAVGEGDLTISVTPDSPNDDCSEALAINEVIDLPFSTAGASSDGAVPGCGTGAPIDIWFAYTATVSGNAFFDLCGSSFNTRMAIWTDCIDNSGIELACNDNMGVFGTCFFQSNIVYSVTQGETYYVQVGGNNETTTGAGELSITVAPVATNDECVNAIVIGEVIDLPFSTVGQTSGGNDPGCGSGAPIDIWYAYSPSADGMATFDLCGSSFDTRLAIWGDCPAINVLACNDDNSEPSCYYQSSLEYFVSFGSTYYVQVGGYTTDTGNGDLTIVLEPVPSNGDCANAIGINEVINLPFSTTLGSASGVNPGCGGNQDPVDIWYAYTATATGMASIDLCGSDYNTRLAVWDACGGSVINCNNDDGPVCDGAQSSLELNVISGNTYYVQIGGWNTNTGDGDLTIYVEQELPNTLNFDGVDDYVDLGTDANLNITGDITIEAWIYPVGVQSRRRIVEKDLATSYHLALSYSSSGIGFAMDSDGSNTNILETPDNLIFNNQWTHVAGTWDGSTMRIYINGIEEASMPWTQTVDGSALSTKIGRSGSSMANFFKGRIDEVKIWNVARTADEIRVDMHHELVDAMSETNLVAYYRFNQVGSTILPDISANSNNGTLINFNPSTAWLTSTAPIPYYSVQTGDWDTDNIWALGQMAPVNDWARVIVDHDINLNQDQTLLELTINNGDNLTVNAGNQLTMDGEIWNFSGNHCMYIKADASGMASLIHNTPNINGTVEQYLTSERWHLVSSPISNATIDTYLDIYLKEYKEPTDTWTYMVEPTTLPLNVAQGYSAWGSDNYTGTTTVDFAGIFNTGDYPVSPISYTTSSPNTGWNLVGNPYPSPLQWNNSWSKANIGDWACIHNNGNDECYNAADGTSWPNTGSMANGIIPSTQGFWVRATSASASMTIPQSERMNSNQAFYKDGSMVEIEQAVRLRVDGNNDFDVVLVQFTPSATEGFDARFDLEKRWGYNESPQIYSINADDNLYSVDVLPEVSKGLVIPVGFQAGTNGLNSITVAEMFGFAGDINVVLEDIKEGKFIDLDENSVYEFIADPSDEKYRFNLLFKDGYNSVPDSEASSINIYSYENVIYVQKPFETIVNDVVVYDIMGQEVLTSNSINGEISKISINNGIGYYLVKATTEFGVITKKVFIK